MEQSPTENVPHPALAGAVETIAHAGRTLCYIVRAGASPRTTAFVTPPSCGQQVGFVVYPAGSYIKRHYHRPIERHLTETTEVLVVRQGRCVLELFDEDRKPVASTTLVQDDVLVLVAGGHGIRVEEDTVLLEVKQGPYTGVDEKERF